MLHFRIQRLGDKPDPQYWSWSVDDCFTNPDGVRVTTPVANGMHCKSQRDAEIIAGTVLALYEAVTAVQRV